MRARALFQDMGQTEHANNNINATGRKKWSSFIESIDNRPGISEGKWANPQRISRYSTKSSRMLQGDLGVSDHIFCFALGPRKSARNSISHKSHGYLADWKAVREFASYSVTIGIGEVD